MNKNVDNSELQREQLTPQRLTEIEAGAKEAEMAQVVNWTSVAKTHTGRVRYMNEDAYFSSEDQALWAVADGMGGHSRGSYASAAVVKSLNSFAKQGSLLQILDSFETLIESAHDKCLNAFRNKRIGTTVAAVLAYGTSCFYLWVGDSRVYRLRDGQLIQLTTDHTVLQDKIARGELSPEDESTHPSAHVLTRAVGVHRTLELEIGHSEVEHGDRYLICSDGLYNELSVNEMHDCMSSGSAEHVLDKLVDLALDRGGKDNMTGIILDAVLDVSTAG